MSRDILKNLSKNRVSITGTLLEVTVVEGKTEEEKKPYKRGNLLVRVAQEFGGRMEVSEIPLSFFATKFKKDGGSNPAYENIEKLETFKTAQEYGLDEADGVRITSAEVQENAFVSKNTGQIVEGWRLRSSFFNKMKISPENQSATFVIEAFILSMTDEHDREDAPTGRLIVKAGIVQYGGKLDIIDFIVENSDNIDYIQRNWEENTTVLLKGRVRYTSSEETKEKSSEDSWGEDIPETSTRIVRELIITAGSNEASDEDNSYDPVDIKKAYNARKAAREQLLIDAKSTKDSGKASPKAAYGWE